MDDYDLDNQKLQKGRDAKSKNQQGLEGGKKIYKKAENVKKEEKEKLGLSISDILATPKSFSALGQSQNRAMSQASTAFDGFDENRNNAEDDFDDDEEEDDDEFDDEEDDDEEFDHEYRSYNPN